MRIHGSQAITVSLLLVAGCSGVENASSATNGNAPASEALAAIHHAEANAQLQQAMRALADAGWQVAPMAQAAVDHLDGAATGALPSADAPRVTWTRVKVEVAQPAGVAGRAERAYLVVAWPVGGEDVFALAPIGSATALHQALAAAPSAAEHTEQSAASAESASSAAEAEVQPLACGGMGTGCSSSARCCFGLACQAYSYYDTCQCGHERDGEYTSKKTWSVGCMTSDNPVGSARYVTHWRGCFGNGSDYGLKSDACGNTIIVPGYYEKQWTAFECDEAPNNNC
jgi:hypothetical protein